MNRFLSMGRETKRRHMSINDNSLHHSIKIKRLSSCIHHTSNDNENNHQFDHFFIFGGDPQGTSFERPMLLANFPSANFEKSEDEVNRIMDFCFPNGFSEITYIQDRKNKSILQNEFVFYLMEDNAQRVYGIAVILYLDDPNIKMPFFCTQNNVKYPFCLCFLTKTPFLSSHFQFCSYLALVLDGEIESVHLKGLEQDVNIKNDGNVINSLVKDKNFGLIAVKEGLEAPKVLVDELIFFYGLPSKSISGFNHKIKLTNDIELNLPLNLKESNALAYPTLHALFSCLSPLVIVQLYNAILLEQHILIVSTNIHKLTLSVIAITQIMTPFQSQALLFPVLPNNETLSQLLETPFPYIIGSVKTSSTPEVVVNLDKGTIQLPNNFPMFPNYKHVVKKLENLLNDSMKSILVPKKHQRNFLVIATKKSNPEFKKFVDSIDIFVFPSLFTRNISIKYVFSPIIIEDIINIFRTSFPPVLQDLIRSCFVTDNTDPNMPVTIMNKELMMSMISDDEQEFYSLFQPTQLFDYFCNSLTDQYSEDKLNESQSSFKLN